MSTMRHPPPDGQNPLPLQLNATKRSCLHPGQRSRTTKTGTSRPVLTACAKNVLGPSETTACKTVSAGVRRLSTGSRVSDRIFGFADACTAVDGTGSARGGQ